jgi:general secretion pathway protein N
MSGLTPAKLITYVLAGLCGLMLLVALVQSLGIGSGYELEQPEAEGLDSALQEPLLVVQNNLAGFPEYSEIEQRPLFNADRRPQAVVVAETPVVQESAPPVPLNATLAGIVLTPAARLALVRNDSTQEVFRVREGMPLPGDLGGWRLKELQPRNAVFDGGSQGEAELKLDPAAEAPPAPGAPPPPVNAVPGQVNPAPGQASPAPGQANPGQAPADAAAQSNDAAAREAEVRRIIEERRRQMREEAERMNTQKKQN